MTLILDFFFVIAIILVVLMMLPSAVKKSDEAIKVSNKKIKELRSNIKKES